MLLGHAANPALPVGPMQAILMTISYLLEEIVSAIATWHIPLCAASWSENVLVLRLPLACKCEVS